MLWKQPDWVFYLRGKRKVALYCLKMNCCCILLCFFKLGQWWFVAIICQCHHISWVPGWGGEWEIDLCDCWYNEHFDIGCQCISIDIDWKKISSTKYKNKGLKYTIKLFYAPSIDLSFTATYSIKYKNFRNYQWWTDIVPKSASRQSVENRSRL